MVKRPRMPFVGHSARHVQQFTRSAGGPTYNHQLTPYWSFCWRAPKPSDQEYEDECLVHLKRCQWISESFDVDG